MMLFSGCLFNCVAEFSQFYGELTVETGGKRHLSPPASFRDKTHAPK